MTVIEKKTALKKIIDKIPEENLDEAFFYFEDLISKNETRKKILLNLLEQERVLFKRLAE